MTDDLYVRLSGVIQSRLSAEFLADASTRDVHPMVLAMSLYRLVDEMDREGAELFGDWQQWSRHQQADFVLGGVQARTELRFPRRGDRDQVRSFF